MSERIGSSGFENKIQVGGQGKKSQRVDLDVEVSKTSLSGERKGWRERLFAIVRNILNAHGTVTKKLINNSYKRVVGALSFKGILSLNCPLLTFSCFLNTR